MHVGIIRKYKVSTYRQCFACIDAFHPDFFGKDTCFRLPKRLIAQIIFLKELHIALHILIDIKASVIFVRNDKRSVTIGNVF